MRGVGSSSCGGVALVVAPSVAVGSSFCATLSCSSGSGAWFRLSRLALRALASAPSRAGRAASTVSRGAASAASGASGSRRRRVLVSRKFRRAASRADVAFQPGWPGASSEALRANTTFEGTPCRPRSFFVGVGARRPSTSRWASPKMKEESLLRLVGKRRRSSRQRAYSMAHCGPVGDLPALLSAVLSSPHRPPCASNASVLLRATDQSLLSSAPAVLLSPNNERRLRRVPSARQPRPACRSCAAVRRPGRGGGFLGARSCLTRSSPLRRSSPNKPFEGTPCRPWSFFVGVGARRPSTSRYAARTMQRP